MATHSSTLAWKIPWMEEPGRLQLVGSWRVGHDCTFTFHFHALEKEMAIHSSVLAWRIPWTEEPGGLPSMGSHRVGHYWSDLEAAAKSPLIWKSLKLEIPMAFTNPLTHQPSMVTQAFKNAILLVRTSPFLCLGKSFPQAGIPAIKINVQMVQFSVV